MSSKEDLQDFYNHYFNKSIDKKATKRLQDNEVFDLYKIPKKDKGLEIPKNTNVVPKLIYQADILYLPTDRKGYKYLLVCVDTADGNTCVEPLKNKLHVNYIKAFTKIFKKMGKPNRIKLDSEFNSKDIKQYMSSNDIHTDISLVNRHRQTSMAERRNQQIGRAIFMRQSAEELITKSPSTNWVDDIPIIIKYLNERAVQIFKQKQKIMSKDKPNTTQYPILEIGTKVRRILDYPISVDNNKRLHGNFRATDIRWSKDTYTICNMIVENNNPPMYRIKADNGDIPHVAYTYNQLQVAN